MGFEIRKINGPSNDEFMGKKQTFKVVTTIAKTLNMKPRGNEKNGFDPLETCNVDYDFKTCQFVLIWHLKIFVIFYFSRNESLSLLFFCIIHFDVLDIGTKIRGYGIGNSNWVQFVLNVFETILKITFQKCWELELGVPPKTNEFANTSFNLWWKSFWTLNKKFTKFYLNQN